MDGKWFDDKSSVLDQLRHLNETQLKIIHRLDQLHSKITVVESLEYSIKKALEELTILKEREMNRMLREHIPFPFQHSSPVAKLPFRRPFSSKTEDK